MILEEVAIELPQVGDFAGFVESQVVALWTGDDSKEADRALVAER